MCGIAGIVTKANGLEAELTLRQMVRTLVHRGPDDEGVAVLPARTGFHAMLGSRRLAIIDRSALGHQPMSNGACAERARSNGSVWITHNGEIYNYASLREQLLACGHHLKSHADTEVVLHLYEEYGDRCVEYLRGMFAFAVWDTKRQRLFAARDRMGEKPLYYYWDGNLFMFASEIKAILSSGLVKRKINPTGVAAFLTFGSLPTPLTIIEGIHSLPPGSYLKFENGNLIIDKYWDVNLVEDDSLGEEECVREVRDLLADSIQGCLVSDVQVGAFLSGGLDSSAVVALMRQAGCETLRTFSIVFEEREFSEASFAKFIARKFGTEHTEYTVSAPEVWQELPAIIRAMDQPTIDGVNTWFVSKITRASGTIVALSGIGGDELFGGYNSFSRVPQLCRIGGVLGAFPYGRAIAARFVRATGNRRAAKFERFLRHRTSPEVAYLAGKGMFLDDDLNRLLAPQLGAPSFDGAQYLASLSHNQPQDIQNKVSLMELRAYMHNQLLRDADNMSMAHSLEVRAPLIDHKLVEFVARIPARLKFRSYKHLLVKAMERELPHAVLERPKMAFAFPFETWFRRQWRAGFEQLLFDSDSPSNQILNPQAIKAQWQNFLDGRLLWTQIWAIIVLKWWADTHNVEV